VSYRWDILFWAVVATVEVGLLLRDRATSAAALPAIALACYLAARRGGCDRR
jgi:hypothetical protein